MVGRETAGGVTHYYYLLVYTLVILLGRCRARCVDVIDVVVAGTTIITTISTTKALPLGAHGVRAVMLADKHQGTTQHRAVVCNGRKEQKKRFARVNQPKER